MLRWLVLALLLCNLIYFLWVRQLQPESAAVESGEAGSNNVEHLVLLSEVAGAAVDGRGSFVEHVGAKVTSEPPAPVCRMVGPFKEKISARQVKDRLQALNINVTTYQLQVPEKPDYWVHLGPMRSRKEALEVLRELQNKKVDSFLITEGELLNGVSLGFFTKEELALAIQKQRREQGYDAKIRQIPRFSQELWEVLGVEQYNKLSEDVWKTVTAGTDGLELRKNSCDLIASAERLD